MTNSRWTELGLSKTLLGLIESAGYEKPTEIQAKVIPIALMGRDLIASAETGSGKTAGFCFPMIEKFTGRRGTIGLILCPTREIALQTHETIQTFGVPLGVSSVVLIGGSATYLENKKEIRKDPQIIVGTPGRICDHLSKGNLWLEYIEVLVLDEADRMLDMGFSKELSRIRETIPKKAQTLLFSATFPRLIESLARRILSRPERIRVGLTCSPPKNIDQELLWLNEDSKKRELMRMIRKHQGSILIFLRTKDGVSRLWRTMHAAGVYDSSYISSNKMQVHREEALQGFKDGKYRILVATDVAGRGIHVEDVGLVINYDIPEEAEDYIHRIGRTGRQDKKGHAISFATAHDKYFVEQIERLLGHRLPESFSRDYDPRPRRRETRRTHSSTSKSRTFRSKGRRY